MEAAVVVADGKAVYWHEPEDRSDGHIGDDSAFWQALWDNRKAHLAVVHSHPGFGRPIPSQTDTTTFFAIERGLGRRLEWWIVTRDHFDLFMCFERDEGFVSLSEGDYQVDEKGLLFDSTRGMRKIIEELRNRSYGPKCSFCGARGEDVWIVRKTDFGAVCEFCAAEIGNEVNIAWAKKAQALDEEQKNGTKSS